MPAGKADANPGLCGVKEVTAQIGIPNPQISSRAKLRRWYSHLRYGALGG